MLDINLISLVISLTTPVMFFALGYIALKEMRKYFTLRTSEEALRYSSDRGIGDTAKETRNFDGYVVLDILDERKSVFHDILKGFEEYASLKGYKASVSVDTSINNKIAYKITLNDIGIEKSSSSVKHDLDEYINEIQSGVTRFTELPKVVSDIDHARLSMALQNRISFLEHNYQVEKNVREFMQQLINQSSSAVVSSAPQTLQIYSGNMDMDKRKYEANNSVGVAQGDNGSVLLVDNAINIGSNNRERNEIISKLDDLLSVIDGKTEFEDASRQIKNIKEEIEESEKPDPSLIQRWLDKAKHAFSSAEKGGEVIQKAKDAYEALGQAMG